MIGIGGGDSGNTGSGYRASQLRCPRCTAELCVQEIAGSAVDHCTECGGLWIDWFDGDLPGIVRSAGPSGVRGVKWPARSPLVCACPRCNRPLEQERFQDSGPVILRCGECLGAFVPAESAPELARFEPREEEISSSSEDGFWRELIAKIRAALGGAP